MEYSARHSSGDYVNFTFDGPFQKLIASANDGFIYLKDKEGKLERIVGVDYLLNSVITVVEEGQGNDISFIDIR